MNHGKVAISSNASKLLGARESLEVDKSNDDIESLPSIKQHMWTPQTPNKKTPRRYATHVVDDPCIHHIYELNMPTSTRVVKSSIALTKVKHAIIDICEDC